MTSLIDWMENTADQVPGASAVLDDAVAEFKRLEAENQRFREALEDISASHHHSASAGDYFADVAWAALQEGEE